MVMLKLAVMTTLITVATGVTADDLQEADVLQEILKDRTLKAYGVLSECTEDESTFENYRIAEEGARVLYGTLWMIKPEEVELNQNEWNFLVLASEKLAKQCRKNWPPDEKVIDYYKRMVEALTKYEVRNRFEEEVLVLACDSYEDILESKKKHRARIISKKVRRNQKER